MNIPGRDRKEKSPDPPNGSGLSRIIPPRTGRSSERSIRHAAHQPMENTSEPRDADVGDVLRLQHHRHVGDHLSAVDGFVQGEGGAGGECRLVVEAGAAQCIAVADLINRGLSRMALT